MARASEESQAPKARFRAALEALKGMNEVDDLIRSKFSSDAPLLEEIPAYLHTLGGKRMRPALCLLTAQAFGMATASEALIDVAAGIELIHMATLLHDDIIDNSPLRRHQSSPFARYGMSQTLLAGDFLLVRAFSLCARLDREIIDATEEACIQLTEGEILETSLVTTPHTLESSLTIASKKTASLFRLASFSAAHLAGLPRDAVNHLRLFGETLGIAFQILDDVLDVTSDEDLLGKRSGQDLRERKPSVVNVLWQASGSSLATRLSTPPEPTDGEEAFIEAALQELRSSSAVSEARRLAREYAMRAASHLSAATELTHTVQSDALSGLHGIIDYTLARVA